MGAAARSNETGIRSDLPIHELGPGGAGASASAVQVCCGDAPPPRQHATSGRRSSFRMLDPDPPAAPTDLAIQADPAQVVGVVAGRVTDEDAAGVAGDGHKPVPDS